MNPFYFILDFLRVMFSFFPGWLLGVLILAFTLLLVLAVWRCIQ